MTAFHQMSDASQNLLDEPELSAFGGAVLSPVNYLESTTHTFTTRMRMKRPADFPFVFDPQLYYPHTKRGTLRQWTYFPKDYESADRSSMRFWSRVTKSIAKTGMDLRARYVASPADVPKVYNNAYYVRLVEIGKVLANAADDRFDPMQSVIVSPKEFEDPTRALKIASLVSETSCPWVYLMIDTDRIPRRELTDNIGLLGVMQLIRALEDANLRVLVAYSSSDVLLWKTAGATACASGKYFNVRRFVRSRWEEKEEGGGGVTEYWFEEALLTFLRQADLLRLQREKLLSKATLDSPFLKPVLDAIKVPEAWLKLSWLQYMHWFADVEERLVTGKVTAASLVDAADKRWGEVDEKGVVMVERHNTGEWVRRWKQALIDFDKWKKTR